MIHSLLCSLPFLVCFFWLILLIIEYPKTNPAKKFLTYFMLTCTILYFSHAVYFHQHIYLYSIIESIYTFCSLAVYPLYYLYICKLTSEKPLALKNYWVLLPAILISITSLIFYGMMSESERLQFVESFFYNNITDYKFSFAATGQIYRIKITHFIFVIQLFPVLYYGLKRLSKFNIKIHNYYSNTGDKTLNSIKNLLFLFVLFTSLSGVASQLGITFFIHKSWLLVIPSILFSILLFSINYIGYKQNFTARDFYKEIRKSKWKETEENHYPTTKMLKKQLHYLMVEEQLFKQKNLRITDVALETGSNRTYVSNCINKKMNLSFSEYINTHRVRYAQSLMIESDNLSLLEISELSGFANETSFYRNFKKIAGVTPNEWLKLQPVNYKNEPTLKTLNL